MISQSKILTVSYGTFSCTLEGFDESFETMKAIAEYFRDLAADDRYFGAEPPTPDAEMLARIAERETARRVEARMDQGSLVLSPASEPAPAAAPAPVEPPTAAPAPAPVAAPAAAPAPAAPPAQAERPVESVAERLARIRAVVRPTAPDADASNETSDNDDGENLFTDSAYTSDLSDLVTEEESSAPLTAAEQRAAAAAFYETLDHGPEAVAEETSAPEAEASAAAEAEEPAETVTQADEESAPEDVTPAIAPTAEDKAPNAEESIAEDDVTETASAEEAAEEGPAETLDEDDLAARLAARRARVGAALAAEMGAETAAEPAAPAPAKEVAPQSQTPASDSAQRIAALLDGNSADDEQAAPEDAPEAYEAEESAAAPIPARVVKMSRESFEAALDNGTLEDVTDESEDEDDTPETDQEGPAIGDAAEDVLRSELAKVEAELDQTEPEADAAPEDDTPATPGAERLRRAAPNAEENMGRLMSEADSQMKAPETRGRLNAIQQLRAAVAATRADRSIAEKSETEAEDSDYRADLSDVVNPRRPAASGTPRSARPAARPAPLKLVAEQRVDANRDEPVRPRRIAGAQPAPVLPSREIEGTFSEFAEEMGATRLPDLLEAAAAYLAFVEGRDAFSRPQLMTTLNSAEPPSYSREDGLRCFGQLLRQGKIEKRGRGQFSVADAISYRPDDTRAAG